LLVVTIVPLFVVTNESFWLQIQFLMSRQWRGFSPFVTVADREIEDVDLIKKNTSVRGIKELGCLGIRKWKESKPMYSLLTFMHFTYRSRI